MTSADLATWTRLRQRVAIGSGLVIIMAVFTVLAFGPWFQITTVAISGTRQIDPTSLQRIVDRYLNGHRYLFIPRRTLWILSRADLTKYLRQRIQTRLSIEAITVTKVYPREVRVNIDERLPFATWTDGSTFGVIDRQGVIVELRSLPITDIPLILDESQISFRIDERQVKPEVIAAIGELHRLLMQAGLDVTKFILPDPNCPAPVVMPPPSNINALSAGNSNTASIVLPVNSSLIVNQAACDVAALRLSRPEIHILLTSGVRVLFDRHSSLVQAVQAVQRVLSEPPAQKYEQIDARFSGRVYLK